MIKGMKNKLVLGLLVLSLVGFGVGYWFSHSYDFGLCFASFDTNTFDTSCHQFYESIGNPLLYGMGALTFVFLVLLFVPRAFSLWWKFAIWFVPLAALIFITAPEPSGWISLTPSPEAVFKWVSGFYILVSLGIIGFASLGSKKIP